MALTGQPTHSMQLSSTRPCCKRCWFRQSRPRLSRTLAIAQKSNSERRPDKAQHTEQGQANSNAEAAASVKASRGSVAQAAEQNGEDRLAAYGDRQASAETNGLLSAVDEIRQASQAAQSSTTPAPHVQQQSRSVSSPASPESSSQPTQQASGSSEPLQGPGPPTKSLSKADTLAKLAQAKAYKQDKSREGGTPAILDTKAITQQPIDPSPAPVQPTDSFSSTQRRPQQPTSAAAGAQDFANHPENNAENGGIGIAARPARFLEQAMQKQSEDSKKMSEEAYSLLKEKQKRSQKVSHIDQQLKALHTATDMTYTLEYHCLLAPFQDICLKQRAWLSWQQMQLSARCMLCQ